jgi:hypothetical protein
MAKNRNPAAAGDRGSEADHPSGAIGAETTQSLIPNQGAATLAEHATAIRARGKRVVGDIIEIGRLLTECKKIAGHGGWLPWLEREFGWSDKTAERFMAVHRLGMKFDNLSDLEVPVSSLYFLTAPSTPDEARTEVIARAEAGEKLPVEEVKRVVPAVPPLNSLVYSEASSKDRQEFFRNIGFAAWWNDAPPEFRELARRRQRDRGRCSPSAVRSPHRESVHAARACRRGGSSRRRPDGDPGGAQANGADR